MKPTWTSDLHVHLYGCLEADDLWQRLDDLWRKDPEALRPRLNWYASEYEKAYGQRPDWTTYLKDSGLDRLRADYEMRESAPFAVFQAKFNLIIALFPLDPAGETTKALMRMVFARHRGQGLRHVEYRTPLPSAFNEAELDGYLKAICGEVVRLDGEFTPRLALSLPRENAALWPRYRWLRAWLGANLDLARAISGIDFCFFEEGYPPADKEAFFRQVHADNKEQPDTALAILYHVGESFATTSLQSSARWVWQAASFGAHRLGHAISLGIEPGMLAGQTIIEPANERRAHLCWLLEQSAWLQAHGLLLDHSKIRAELRDLGETPVPTVYDDATVAACRVLQECLLQDLHQRGTIIESCPTSNFRIGGITRPSQHPLPRFLAAGINVVVASDDPGLFGASLADEERLCRTAFGLEAACLARMAALAETARSESLSGRDQHR